MWPLFRNYPNVVKSDKLPFFLALLWSYKINTLNQICRFHFISFDTDLRGDIMKPLWLWLHLKLWRSLTWELNEDFNQPVEFGAVLLPATDDVLLQQLLDYVGDVGHVYFVDETVDGLLQRFPAHPLVRQTVGKRKQQVGGKKIVSLMLGSKLLNILYYILVKK